MENNQNFNPQFDPFRQTIRDVNALWPDPIGSNKENVNRFAYYYLIIEALVKAEDFLKKDVAFESNFHSVLNAIKTGTLDSFLKQIGADTHPF